MQIQIIFGIGLEIEQTEQRLDILYREKELRDKGYTWDEIKDLVQEEFDIEPPADFGHGKMFGGRFGGCKDSGFFRENENINPELEQDITV